MSFKKVLIAIDNSPCSMHAAKKGFALARTLNIPAGLIFVIDRSREVVSADLDITPLESASILLGQAEETISQMIRMYYKGDASEVSRFTPEGLPKEEILSTAKEWGADLIIVGTHSRTGLARFFLGSTAEYIVRHAHVPVMVVPEQ